MALSRVSDSRTELGPASRQRRRVRAQDLRELARFLWEKGQTLTHATERDAALWVRTLKRRTGSGKSPLDTSGIFRKIALARGFFDRLRGSQSPNPFGRYKTRSSDRPVPTALPLAPQDLKRLLEVMNPESPWGRRNRAIALLRFSTGLSIAEICRLKSHEVVLGKNSSVLCPAGKGRPSRRIRLPRPVALAVRNYRRRNPTKGPFLFQAMPESLSPAQAPAPGRSRRPLSAKWVSSMLRKAALRVGLSIRRV
jgi:site-specific recombinase XerD